MSEHAPCNEGEAKASGERHSQIQPHTHKHHHAPICPRASEGDKPTNHHGNAGMAGVLTIRSHTGISGDILLCGLGVLLCHKRQIDPQGADGTKLWEELGNNILPELKGSLHIRPHLVEGIAGWQAEVKLPHAHEARNLADITVIVSAANMGTAAKQRAIRCFELLAQCEAAVHHTTPEEIHFHEVGALDSILDICGTCELHERLGSPAIISSPLPVADGQVNCAHGVLPAPAPATLKLLENVPVYPFAGQASAGELLTPTGIALLKALDAKFGKWPQCLIKSSAIVYGQREFAQCANGVIFVSGFMAQ